MDSADISLICDTAEKPREAVIVIDATFLRWGLTVSTKKTKVLVVNRDAAAQSAEVVSQFKYMGSIFTSDCTLDTKIMHRVIAAHDAFQQVRQANTWSSRAMTLSVQVQFFYCIVMSVLLSAGET